MAKRIRIGPSSLMLLALACGETKSNDPAASGSDSSSATSTGDAATANATSGDGGVGGATTNQAANATSSPESTSTTLGSSASATGSTLTNNVGAGGLTMGTSSSGTLGGAGGRPTNTTNSSTGMGGMPGAGGFTSTTAAGTGGTGGMPDDCAEPYTGPIGGPLEAGPEPLNSLCETIADEVILARYKDTTAKVPQGLYWEPPGIVSLWEAPCSEGEQSTLERADSAPLGEQEGSLASEWSYEVSGCQDGTRRFYSNLRCDYFDGETISNGSIEKLAYLASLLWWMDHGNLAGSQILGYVAAIGDATDRVDMCTIRTTFGDFGLCDEITLEVSQHRMVVGTQVTIGEPTTVRTIQGDCN